MDPNSCEDQIHGGFVHVNVKSPSDTFPTELVALKNFTTQNFSVLFDDLNVSSCSDLSPTQLEVNDIYGRLIDTHRKAILCYRRILYNIKNWYENDEQQKKLGYKTLNNLFREFDRLLNTARSADEILHFLEGRATLRLNIDGGTTKKKSVIVVKDLLNGNYEVNLDKSTDDDDNDIGDDDTDMLYGDNDDDDDDDDDDDNDDGDDRDGISIEYILENRSHLINTLSILNKI